MPGLIPFYFGVIGFMFSCVVVVFDRWLLIISLEQGNLFPMIFC
jgi:hypothetical protein